MTVTNARCGHGVSDAPSRQFSMHADTGCPAIAYPSDLAPRLDPYVTRALLQQQLGGGGGGGVGGGGGDGAAAFGPNTTLALSFRVQPAAVRARPLHPPAPSASPLSPHSRCAHVRVCFCGRGRERQRLPGLVWSDGAGRPAVQGGAPRLVRVALPSHGLRSELVGMMSAPATPSTKPYWVFGLPLWRHYRTTHVLLPDGTPQLQLDRLRRPKKTTTTTAAADEKTKQGAKKKTKTKKKKTKKKTEKGEL
jgi:hypothetical protein